MPTPHFADNKIEVKELIPGHRMLKQKHNAGGLILSPLSSSLYDISHNQ
jgi:hypothetical protein